MSTSHIVRKPKSPPPAPVQQIEGENVTRAQIAERLGLTLDQVSKRMTQARKLPGPITWEKLK